MSSDWQKVELRDLIEIKHGYAYKGEYFSEDATQLILLTPGNFEIGGGFSESKFKYYSEKGDCPVEYILDSGDLIITMTDLSKNGDTLGYPAIVPPNNGRRFLHNQRIGRVVFLNDRIDKYYLYYLMCTREYRHQILSTCTGSTVKHTAPSRIIGFAFMLPSPLEQRSIAATLSVLDDKIELNNRINKTLEETAQALFKRWFVDFEFPDENDQPYMSSGGEMEESELGLIPKGWKIESLDRIADYLNGLAMQKYRPEGEDFLPVIKIRELNQGKPDRQSDKANPNIDSKYIVNDGDVLFSWSGSLDVKIWCGGKGGLNQHLFKVTSGRYEKWFYYLWTKYHLEKFRGIAQDKATTMGHIQRKHLQESFVFAPPQEALARMNSIMRPIFDIYITRKIETASLVAIRDTILPKLISGEIRLNESFAEGIGNGES